MLSLSNKTVLITGGSRGIGLAIAHAFARHDASTILVGRNPDTLESAVASIRSTARAAAAAAAPRAASSPAESAADVVPASHTSAQGDVCLAATWQELLRRVESRELGGPLGRVDVLVNCAGVAQRSLLVKTSPEDVDALLDANLKSAVLGCKYIGRQMFRAASAFSRSDDSLRNPSLSPSVDSGGRGEERVGREEAGLSIINVSSVMASRGGHGASVYAASKAGILGRLFETLIFVALYRVI